MSAAADAGGRHEGPMFRLGMLVGHYFERWQAVLHILVWIHITAGWWLPKEATETGPLRWAGTLVVTIYVFGFFCEVMVHERNLCLRDLDDAPLLNPQAAVDKHRSALRLYHNRRQHLVVVLSGAVPLFILFVMILQDSVPLVLKLVLTALAVLGVMASVYAQRVQGTHRRLQPWCPWCRRPGDDDDDPVVAPEPDPVGTADR